MNLSDRRSVDLPLLFAIGIILGHAHDCAGFEIDDMLSLVRQVRASLILVKERPPAARSRAPRSRPSE
jgi:hypothetical protein